MAEKSTTKNSSRIIALTGAIVFLITSSALAFFVIWDLVHQPDASAPASTDTATTCTMDSPPAKTLEKPDVFKPEGTVEKLSTKDLAEGTGKTAAAGDCLIVKYYGTLASNGDLFDEDFTKPLGLQFQLGQGQVIPGWDQGVVGMKEGGMRRIVIPSDLGYGEAGSPPTIPANSDLVFVVKLIEVKE